MPLIPVREHSTFSAFTDAPTKVLTLATTYLNDYAAARGAELGLVMPAITDDAFYDYDPGAAGAPWRFQMFTEDGPLDISSISTVRSDLLISCGVAGQDADLALLTRQLRAMTDAMVRMFHDEASRNDELVNVTRATLGLALKQTNQDWYAVATGVKVLIRSAESSQ